jgi:cell division protein FtsZ
MTLNLQLPKKPYLKPSITVFGVGGAGGNAVNNMISAKLEGINFVVANTDAQSLENALAEQRIQLGETITQGLGAGSYPEVGKAAAEEASDEILDHLQGSNMVFITAGMGGGTGTGAAPVVARLAREQGVLTVAVVTKPFHFEGSHRMRLAEQGIAELAKYVDTLIITPNQNLFRVADKSTTFKDAFKLADNVLRQGVQGITDLMVMPGLINLDFADIRSVMGEMGKAMMGTGEAEGDNRAIDSAEAAISNPLLDNVSMKGARGVLINITGGADLTLFEVDEAANRIRDEVDETANIIFGSTFDEALEGRIRVSVVATGIESEGDAKAADKIFAAKAPEKAAPQAEEETAEDKEDSLFSGGLTKENEAVVGSNFAGLKINKKEEASGEEGPKPFSLPDPAEPISAITKTRIAPLQEENAAEEDVQEKKRCGLSFFGLGKKAAVAEDAPEETLSEETRQEKVLEDAVVSVSAASKPSAEGEEDIFDIPAFIRRKPE